MSLTRRLLAAVVAIAILLIGQLVTTDGLVGNLFLLVVGDDTEYAPGYSEKAFEQVQIGDPEQRVHELLGAPLSAVDSKRSGSKVLHYSTSPADTHFRVRAIRITDGRVEKVVQHVWYD